MAYTANIYHYVGSKTVRCYQQNKNAETHYTFKIHFLHDVTLQDPFCRLLWFKIAGYLNSISILK